ncbi:MAG: MFS transporter, partial [Actinobacteria bacterium]|nr:MFS transporter [Actinomycetota bacterium]
MAASTFVQFFFGNLAPFLLDEFKVSRSRLGLLTTTAFVVGGLGSLPAGHLVDRLGGRKVFVGLLGLVITSTLNMAFAPSFASMLFGAALAGGALAACNPTTNKLIADHIAPGERGWIVGIKQAGVQFGAFFTGAVLPVTAVAMGWRVALAGTVVVPAAALAAVLLLIPRDSRPPEEPGPDPGGRTMTSTVWWMTAYAALMGAGVAAIGAWIPLYAQEGVGLSVNTAGAIAATIGLVGIASRVAWGWGSERIGQFSMPLAVMGLGSTVASLLLIAASAAGPWLLWFAAVLFGATAVTWNAVGMLAIVAEVAS